MLITILHYILLIMQLFCTNFSGNTLNIGRVCNSSVSLLSLASVALQ